MNYGYFDDPNREYVITDPRTPTKWINYIGTLQFGGFVDHTGGALICKNDPTFNRITKYIQQMPSSDFKGETLYLRITQVTGFKVFSPFFVPTLDPYDKYECRVGLGYTRILSEFHGIRTEVTIFVPINAAVEIRDIQITNISDKPLEVDAIPVLEYTHPDALKQFTNADWIPQTMTSKAVKDTDCIVLIQYPFMFRDIKVNYFTSNLPVSSFETDRKKFLGENEYGTWAKPVSLQNEELSDTEALRGDNIAALMHHLGIIQPGETKRLTTQLGQAAKLADAEQSIETYRNPQSVDDALTEMKLFWDEYLSTLQVETPDAAMNAILNIHNPRQCYITRQWSRYLSCYQLGLGARGIGIRDSSQDILGVMANIPHDAKRFLKTLLSFQKQNGSAMHQFNPLTMEGSLGDSAEVEDRPHYYSDDHLWSVLGVTAYIKETGDVAFLDEMVPFYEKDKDGNPLESSPVLDHVKCALTFTRTDTGKHGLPLLGFADWNDTLNLATGAESLFSAHLYGRALNEFIALLDDLGKKDDADEWRKAHAEMRTRVEEHAWDGEWYMMYFDHDGTPVGSHKNQYGQIHLNGQSWAVLSGFASQERAHQAMDSVYKHLNTKYGIKLSTPGYNGFDPRYGGVTTYPPGAKENGGIFLHPNPWAMIAETMLGNGDRAYEYYSQINPAGKNDMIDLYESEPYVYPQNILGDEHPQFGLARNSWLSGTASWMYQAGTQWILGIRAEYNGLCIDPCIPSKWDGFKATRKYRGVTYHITVTNPKHVCKGVEKVMVNGGQAEGRLIRAEEGVSEVNVEITMG
ncbi:MAG TPA: glycosyl hydrolase family 65 protein [Anaerolineales bacterium]|nr:glycosyl hydrolase family 65 protein [Anaerolineales bacterium]